MRFTELDLTLVSANFLPQEAGGIAQNYTLVSCTLTFGPVLTAFWRRNCLLSGFPAPMGLNALGQMPGD